MKQRLPAILTGLLIFGAFVFFANRQRIRDFAQSATTSTANQPTPEETIWRMADASRDGDAQVYLDCFSGALRQNLQKTKAEMGDEAFRQYLKRLNEEVTGIAVSDLQHRNETEASLRVEFVFRGRNEAQTHHFKLTDGRWRIERVDESEKLKPLVPYGAEVRGQE